MTCTRAPGPAGCRCHAACFGFVCACKDGGRVCLCRVVVSRRSVPRPRRCRTRRTVAPRGLSPLAGDDPAGLCAVPSCRPVHSGACVCGQACEEEPHASRWWSRCVWFCACLFVHACVYVYVFMCTCAWSNASRPLNPTLTYSLTHSHEHVRGSTACAIAQRLMLCTTCQALYCCFLRQDHPA